MVKFFAFLGGALFIILGIIFDGFVLTKLWSWFIVPLFNLPMLSITYAIGISVLVSYFKPYKKSEKLDMTESITLIIVKPILFLVFGFIIKLFI